MSNAFQSDRMEAILDHNTGALYIRATGADRSNLIATMTRQLDHHQLYVASMVFSLQLPFTHGAGPTSFPYHMEIEARGDGDRLSEVNDRIRDGEFLATEKATEGSSRMIDWFTSYYFHLYLLTPDRKGITAGLSRLVGKLRQNENEQESAGNFVYLTATTLNDAGPHGGTPYFKLRANVAVESSKVMRELLEDLTRYAASEGMENELKLISLD